MTPETIRPELADVAGIPEDLTHYTLREAVDFLKGFDTLDLGEPTKAELDYATTNFETLLQAISEREGLPVPMLGYVVQETAQTEIHLVHTALAEADAAGLDIVEAELDD